MTDQIDDRQEIAAAQARYAQLLKDGFTPTQEELTEARMVKDSVDSLGPAKSLRQIAAMLRAIREMQARGQGTA